jgi:hypothetical protein
MVASAFGARDHLRGREPVVASTDDALTKAAAKLGHQESAGHEAPAGVSESLVSRSTPSG